MSYEIATPIFEGPLELLLHLIEKNELDITKVALAKVTDEFLAQVNVLREKMQIEVIADFLAVAARLLWIKSRALLPKPPESARLARDEDDVGDELIRQLRAYRQYKEAAQWLRERDGVGLRAYVHVGTTPRPQHFTIDLSGVTVADLRAAAQAVLFPAEGVQPQEAIQRPRISIVQQIPADPPAPYPLGGIVRARRHRDLPHAFEQAAHARGGRRHVASNFGADQAVHGASATSAALRRHRHRSARAAGRNQRTRCAKC